MRENAMGVWKLLRAEPSLEELLADDMMGWVTKSAGTDRAGLRALLSEMAGRLSAERFAAITPRCASPARCDCPQPAG
jgi:hypothetical protein